jgi:cytochrome c-type biogenesis protein CcmH
VERGDAGDDPVTSSAGSGGAAPGAIAAGPARANPLRRSWLPWVPLLLVVVLALAIGALGDTGPATNEERVVAIASTVKCPECSGESVAESNSSFSRAARIEIAEQVQAGRTDDEIRDYLEGRYDGILLTPTSSGVAGLIWIIPVVAFVFSLAGLAVAFRRWNQRPTREVTDDDRDLVRQALDDEHRRQTAGPRPAR